MSAEATTVKSIALRLPKWKPKTVEEMGRWIDEANREAQRFSFEVDQQIREIKNAINQA